MTIDDLLAKWNGGALRGAPRKFARALRVSETYFSSIRSGRNRPGPDLVGKIAELLKIAPAEAAALFPAAEAPAAPRDSAFQQLLRELPPSYAASPVNVVSVPIVGRVAASGIDYAPDEPPRGFVPFPMYGPTIGRLEALIVSGDSQDPTAPDGSFVTLKSRDFFRSGKMAVVRVDGQLLLKRVTVEGEILVLASDNKKHKPARYAASKVEILAVVHQIVIVREP